MHYTDLITRTQALAEGAHVIYELPDGKVEIRNTGVRQAMLSPRPEFRLYLHVDGRELCPRHSDFFSDYLLKIETRPELRLVLTEACEQVCNGMSPQHMLAAKRLPRRFSEVGNDTWSLQTSAYQTAGLPTEVFLCGLQCLIRIDELNQSVDQPTEAFRKAFIGLEKGESLPSVVQSLIPQIKPAKRYYNRLER
jgi:hypothetical protein